MELRQLRYFVAVAEERHFGRAAERLHIAQPPLSQQIRRFEAELGEPLLYRTTRSVELSPAGEVLLERAREILAAVDSAIDDARRAARGEYGRLAIGFTGSSTYEMLPSLAAALRHELPGVMLDLRGELLTPAQVAQLIDGTLDLGLLRPPVHERELNDRGAPIRAADRRPPGFPSTCGLRGGPTRATQGRTVHHLSVPLQICPPRRCRGRLRGSRLQTARRPRSRRDRHTRQLRGGRARGLARPSLGAPHDRSRCDLPSARSGRDARRARRSMESR